MFWGFWGSTGAAVIGWRSSDGVLGVRVKMMGREMKRRREGGWAPVAGG